MSPISRNSNPGQFTKGNLNKVQNLLSTSHTKILEKLVDLDDIPEDVKNRSGLSGLSRNPTQSRLSRDCFLEVKTLISDNHRLQEMPVHPNK